MNSKPHTKEQAREFFKQEALKEICEIIDFTRFHTRVFCVIAKYGLQLEAKEEELLSGDEWSNPECKDVLVKRVKLCYSNSSGMLYPRGSRELAFFICSLCFLSNSS